MHLQSRVISLFIILSSLFPYLSWGKGSNSAFLFEIEWQIFSHINTDASALLHPMVLIPITGQLVILIFGVIYPKIPLVYLGILCLFMLIGFVMFIGFFSQNSQIILSCIPFLLTSVLYILLIKKK